MILLLFVILATMFVSSSVNNIVNVTTALDNYFEMAKVPDYLVVTMNKNVTIDIEETVNMANAAEDYEIEKILFLAPENFIFEDKNIGIEGGTNFIQSDIGMNYFLSDGSILKKVKPGEFYMTEGKADTLGIDVGDKLTIELNGVSREVVLAGKIKDAMFGSNQLSFTRYILSDEDFQAFLLAENTMEYYGGNLIYLYSSDVETLLSQIKTLIITAFFLWTRQI